jgi:FkbH-like protein
VLAAELADRKGAFIWDYDRFVRAFGYDNLSDPKMWYFSSNPYRQSAYPPIVDDLMRYLRSALGRMKKCVVLDLDNTLWGGIAGEDGMEGVALGHTYPGNCFRDFQKELLKLYHRGILLAINSKNNEADALRIIEDHPDMILRRRHFAAIRINWADKGTNLRELARELNIGLDSFIFVDDNPAECELVRRECPECDVVVLPRKPYLLPRVPGELPGIENIRLTDEDRHKGEMYRAQSARQDAEARSANIDDFLASLEIEAGIEAAAPFSIPRIAQLTQKTNQMNMTTRRYTESQIQALVNEADSAVFSVSSKDRFGDNGIIGVIILKFAKGECRIDTLLLSCRVIGRGIEQLMVAYIAEFARKRGTRALVGEFLPTPKNQPAAGFYERVGFRSGADGVLTADLERTPFPFPPHIRAS